MSIKRLNHAVLYVREAEAAAQFYMSLLGFVIVEQMPGAIFLRATASDNHHDLGLFSIGPTAAPPGSRRAPGLYHLAWEVEQIDDLIGIREKLIESGAFVGESDHGTSLSLYAQDQDGIEFEVFWPVPQEEWHERGFGTRPLHLELEVAKRKSA